MDTCPKVASMVKGTIAIKSQSQGIVLKRTALTGCWQSWLWRGGNGSSKYSINDRSVENVGLFWEQNWNWSVMAIQKQTDSICNYLFLCLYGISAFWSRWPEASYVCCFQNHPCLYIQSLCTLGKKKIQQALNRNRLDQGKNRSVTHTLSPR